MKNISKFDKWFPIFKGGIKKDTQGRTHDGDRLIDRMIETFNPGKHEPPLAVGIPKESSPAFGWVEALKATFSNGKKTLLARFRQVFPDIEQALINGDQKKFDISLYKDGTLRRVGLQGVNPPTLPGLENLNHRDGGEVMTFEFDEKDNQRDAGAILDGKIQEILRNPPKVDDYGRPLENFSYRDAMNVAIRENQELASEYFPQILPERETLID